MAVIAWILNLFISFLEFFWIKIISCYPFVCVMSNNYCACLWNLISTLSQTGYFDSVFFILNQSSLVLIRPILTSYLNIKLVKFYNKTLNTYIRFLHKHAVMLFSFPKTTTMLKIVPQTYTNILSLLK